MSDAVFFGTYHPKLENYKIISTINNLTELGKYNDLTIVIQNLNIFGDIIDILNAKENYLKPNNLSLYIINYKILFADWSVESAQEFELYAMLSQFESTDKNILDNVCNKVINAGNGNQSWIENISYFRSLLNN